MLLKTCLRHRYKLVFLCFSCCTPRTLRHGLLAMLPSKFCFVTAQIRILHKTTFGPAQCRPQALVITLRTHTPSFPCALSACLPHSHTYNNPPTHSRAHAHSHTLVPNHLAHTHAHTLFLFVCLSVSFAVFLALLFPYILCLCPTITQLCCAYFESLTKHFSYSTRLGSR